jgi:hypothetical protein
LTDITEALVTRAKAGTAEKAIATAVVITPGPSAAEREIAYRRGGIDIIASRILITIVS